MNNESTLDLNATSVIFWYAQREQSGGSSSMKCIWLMQKGSWFKSIFFITRKLSGAL